MTPCEHLNFACNVNVNRITVGEGGPVESYSADVTIACDSCGLPFRFLGLPMGLDPTGACVSADGTEARLAIHPKGEALPGEDKLPPGFRILNHSPKDTSK